MQNTKDGRAAKKRIKGKLDKVIDAVSDVKAQPVNALDVKKAAVSLEQMDVNYIQSWSVLKKSKVNVEAKGQASYQLLLPYLKAFSQLNPDALCLHECDNNNHLTRVFVCPGRYLSMIGCPFFVESACSC